MKKETWKQRAHSATERVIPKITVMRTNSPRDVQRDEPPVVPPEIETGTEIVRRIEAVINAEERDTSPEIVDVLHRGQPVSAEMGPEGGRNSKGETSRSWPATYLQTLCVTPVANSGTRAHSAPRIHTLWPFYTVC